MRRTWNQIRAVKSAILLAGAVLGIAAAQSGPPDVPDVSGARDTLEKYVETRRIISAEKRDWALGREMLEERIDVVQGAITSWREKLEEARGSIAEADRKRAELLAEKERYTTSFESLEGTVVTLESRTMRLLGRLPDPIREKVRLLSQGIPEDPKSTRLSLGQRFQNVVGILNEIDKFNREITVTSEVRTLSDGSPAEVTVMYLGIGAAYFASADGAHAGVGSGAEEEWTWTPADADAAAVADAIAIWKSDEDAAFVRLPVRIE